MTAPDRAGFLAAILADPADDNPRLAYADALRESADAFDRAHGEFLWAGLTLARYRGLEPATDGTFFEAARAQADTARPVLRAQLAALVGWAPGEWGWDNDAERPDRVTAARFPPAVPDETRRARQARRGSPTPREAVVWERGCVAGLRLPLAACVSGGGALRQCPVEWLEAIDAPGLTLRAVREPDGGWRAAAALDLPARPATAGGDPARPAARLFRANPAAADSAAGIPRDALVALWGGMAARLVAEVRRDAGGRWPGPPDAPAV